MALEFYKDNLITIYQGDCRSMVELPDKSVQCVVTSPPFWGLRKYAGNQELIWGGDLNCEHHWRSQIKKGITGGKDNPYAEKLKIKGVDNYSEVADSYNASCFLCNAWQGAYGLENSPELYIQHSVEILREIRRVLRDDGVVWLNIGDSYASNVSRASNGGRAGFGTLREGIFQRNGKSIKPLDLCLIPESLKIALRADGWYIRSTIHWIKDNPMPESVSSWRWERHKVKIGSKLAKSDVYMGQRNEETFGKPTQVIWRDCPGCPKCLPNDGLVLRKGSWRPTDAVEYILMLTKTDSYYCDQEAVREPLLPSTFTREKYPRNNPETKWGQALMDGQQPIYREGREDLTSNPSGRNLRNAWQFSTQPYPEAHFATFPEELPRRCILASTPEVGSCAKCGKPWARIVDIKYEHINYTNPREYSSYIASSGEVSNKVTQTLGWKASCNCGIEERRPALVLDPFLGSGTTLAVAKRLGRYGIGYELSQSYCELARRRVEIETAPFPNLVVEAQIETSSQMRLL